MERAESIIPALMSSSLHHLLSSYGSKLLVGSPFLRMALCSLLTLTSSVALSP